MRALHTRVLPPPVGAVRFGYAEDQMLAETPDKRDDGVAPGGQRCGVRSRLCSFRTHCEVGSRQWPAAKCSLIHIGNSVKIVCLRSERYLFDKNA